MSRLQETKRAYDKIADLLDQEIRKRKGSAAELERFRQTLDVAFYLLGWGQFEHLVRQEAETHINEHARAHTSDGHAWRYLKENVKNFPVRRRLDLIFHGNHKVLAGLQKDYTLRNDAAHDYKLPAEAREVSGWLGKLEELVDKF